MSPEHAYREEVKASCFQKPATWLIHPQTQIKPDSGSCLQCDSKGDMQQGHRELDGQTVGRDGEGVTALGEIWKQTLCLQVPTLSQLSLKWSDLQNASAGPEM